LDGIEVVIAFKIAGSRLAQQPYVIYHFLQSVSPYAHKGQTPIKKHSMKLSSLLRSATALVSLALLRPFIARAQGDDGKLRILMMRNILREALQRSGQSSAIT
jgi:hypothetical protein